MSSPFIGEIRLMSFSFPPKGWALCHGQLLLISQNQALFSLLGTQYGGNGATNFLLPDLRGRMPLHMGGNYVIGQAGGEVAHTLSIAELPAHTHSLQATASSAAAGVGPEAGLPAVAAHAPYRSGNLNPPVQTRPTLSVGSSQPHLNLQPYTTLNFCIALQGIFPPRN